MWHSVTKNKNDCHSFLLKQTNHQHQSRDVSFTLIQNFDHIYIVPIINMYHEFWVNSLSLSSCTFFMVIEALWVHVMPIYSNNFKKTDRLGCLWKKCQKYINQFTYWLLHHLLIFLWTKPGGGIKDPERIWQIIPHI